MLASEDNDFLIKMGVSRKLLTEVMYQQKAVADQPGTNRRGVVSQMKRQPSIMSPMHRFEVETLKMTLRNVAMIGVAAGLAVLPTAAIAAKVVVVRSMGPSAKAFPPGKALSDTTSIKLGSGDIVTLIGPSSSKTLRGPGTFDGEQQRRWRWLRAAAAASVRFGPAKSPTTRACGTSTQPRAARCVYQTRKAEPLAPRRGNGRGEDQHQRRRQAASGRICTGTASLAWPAKLPVTDGSEYQIEWVEAVRRTS